MIDDSQHESAEQQQLASAFEFNCKLADVSSRFRALNIEIVALLKTHPTDPHFCAKILRSQGMTKATFIECGVAMPVVKPANN